MTALPEQLEQQEVEDVLRLAPLELHLFDGGVGVGLDTLDGRLEVVYQAEGPHPAAPSGAYIRYVKPSMDFAGALILVIFMAPILLGAMLLIAVTMGRPVVFKQQRVGRGGTPFTIYKLRTMRDDPEYLAKTLQPNADGRIRHKTADDPRITPLGRTLRKWNIDELPQLVNVLKGQMSLVGPRPELVEIVEHYESWQHDRHHVKPGITGLWQISARNGEPMHECTAIDLRYTTNVTFREDCRLLLLTVPSALGQQRGV